MQVIVPLATTNTLFNKEEYFFPKPLIEIAGHPMIELVIENLKSIADIEKFIFIVTEDDVKKFSLDKTIRHAAGNIPVDIIVSKHETGGSLCSCLLAIDHLDLSKPLLISNGDQIFDFSLDDVISDFRSKDADAGVVIFDSVHPRWSYVNFDKDEKPCQFSEKDVISRNAIAGIYYFKNADSFIQCAFYAIRNELTTNGNFYISPSLNKLILDNKTILSYKIKSESYHSFYSPQKLKEYENIVLKKSHCAVEFKKPPIKIIIPAAGLGSRFSKAGYALPKPFIDVLGKPMIERVMENLEIKNREVLFYVILQSAHVKQYPSYIGKLKKKGVTIVEVDGLTEGTACTILHLVDQINNDSPVLIANSDQLVDGGINDYIEDALMRQLDGSILCFEEPSRDPKWSYVAENSEGYLTEVKEKVAISSIATVGIYFFNKGKEFVESSVKMIAANDRVNNEFYTCPVYNYLIHQNKKVGYFLIEKEAMHGLGTPNDLEEFLQKNKSECIA